jgi:hypothetical protein
MSLNVSRAIFRVHTTYLQVGREGAERGKWPAEETDYDLIIVSSNLPKADASPRT